MTYFRVEITIRLQSCTCTGQLRWLHCCSKFRACRAVGIRNATHATALSLFGSGCCSLPEVGRLPEARCQWQRPTGRQPLPLAGKCPLALDAAPSRGAGARPSRGPPEEPHKTGPIARRPSRKRPLAHGTWASRAIGGCVPCHSWCRSHGGGRLRQRQVPLWHPRGDSAGANRTGQAERPTRSQHS
jgi:hypothetical protein